MYLAILYAQNGNGETFCISRPVTELHKKKIIEFLCKEGKCDEEEVDTVLVIKNNDEVPSVVKHWSAMNGDI